MSILLRFATCAIAFCVLLLSVTDASSHRRNALNYLSLVEGPTLHTPSHRVHALSSFDLTFELHGKEQTIKLSLEPNHDIIPDDASVQYLDSNGDVARTERINRHDHRVFKGRAWIKDENNRWSNVGWARLLVHKDGAHPLFEGAFSVLRDHHHIVLRSKYLQTKHDLDPDVEAGNTEDMVVFRDSDYAQVSDLPSELKRSISPKVSCPSDELRFNVQPEHPVYSKTLKRETGYWGTVPRGSLFGKRQIDTNGFPGGGNSAGVNLRNTIGQTEGCPGTRKVALVGVATDCTYTDSFSSQDEARSNVISQLNSASDVYERTFNITLGLQNLTISDPNCPGAIQAATPWNTACSNNVTLKDRLNTFSQWRGTQKDTNSHWTLLTTCETDTAVGLAWLGQACTSQAQSNSETSGSGETVSGANVVAKTDTEWQVIA
ncbi:MAG: hypothetical protein M1833_006638 [Piccolia ochrophora]|nr:MAG: hypothetical protein M1833_006638 [Piccolia ochrophora]